MIQLPCNTFSSLIHNGLHVDEPGEMVLHDQKPSHNRAVRVVWIKEGRVSSIVNQISLDAVTVGIGPDGFFSTNMLCGMRALHGTILARCNKITAELLRNVIVEILNVI